MSTIPLTYINMKYIYRVYLWTIAHPLFIILTLLTAFSTAFGSILFGSRIWGYYPGKVWAKCVCFIWGIRIKVKGRENIDKNTSYVFVANHQSAVDIWVVYGWLNHNFKWLMKKGLRKVFMVGYACHCAGHVFVDDKSIAGVKETIEAAEKQLKDGMSVVIFPEGSRTWDGHLNAFKRGAFMLASEFKLPVVPITIDGAYKAMPRTTYNVTPTTVTMTIHPPIYPGEKGFAPKKLLEQCFNIINDSLPLESKAKVEEK